MIVLASKSPRRKEILEKFKIEALIEEALINEIYDYSLEPSQATMKLALQKAQYVYKNHQEDLIIGADTVVVINNKVLGKPHSYEEALEMLELLQGKTHEVVTGVCLIKGKITKTFSETTKVTFKPMTLSDIEEYIKNDNVYDKAGAYAIQSEYMHYIDHIEGEYYNVVGLPIERLLKVLEEFSE